MGPARINANECTTLTLDTVYDDFNLYYSALTVGGFGNVAITNMLYGGYFGQGSLTKDGFGTLTLAGRTDPWSVSLASIAVQSGP